MAAFLGRAERAGDLLRPEHDDAQLRAQPRAGEGDGAGGRDRHHPARPRGEPRPVARTCRSGGSSIREVALRPDGRLDPEDFARQVTARTRLVAVGLASNALGTVNDVALARRLSQRGRGLAAPRRRPLRGPSSRSTSWRSTPTSSSARPTSSTARTSASSTPGPACSNACAPTSSASRRTRPPTASRPGTLNHAALAGVKAAVDYIAAWGEGGTLRERIVSAMERDRRLRARRWAPTITTSVPADPRASPSGGRTSRVGRARPRSRSPSTASPPRRRPRRWARRGSRSGTATSTRCGRSRSWAWPSGAA